MEPDLLQKVTALLREERNRGGCTEEDCGCPGSVLSNTIRNLWAEFGEVYRAHGITREEIDKKLEDDLCGHSKRKRK